ncbi:MAG: 5,10-methylenetetrahydrofolate reductase [Ruminococcaceae bacterium]|nr:5,10-methylenetetrahydrofolate reductase [Oscillospiraceae bacterium]
MRVTEIFPRRKTLSLELFPPKSELGMQKLDQELERLYALEPDYISCTYGAGGKGLGKHMELLCRLSSDAKTIPMTHFTCIGSGKEYIRHQLQSYLDIGVDHILALRGDLPNGWSGTRGDLQYASELVSFIREAFGDRFTIAVAGSPEGHIECKSIESDIEFLKHKQDCGADFILTQLCWDMEQFERWLEKIRAAGITMPVDVGIMPILDQAATINMALSRNACVLPRKLCELITRHWIFPNPFDKNPYDEEAETKKLSFRKAGIEYTIEQIEQFKKMDVSGFHLYALNRYDDVAYIAQQAGLLERN